MGTHSRKSELFKLVANVIGMFASRARERSEHSEQSLQLLLDSMNEGLMTVDSRGFITWANRAISQMFGYQLDELVGHHSTAFMDEPNRGRPDPHLGAHSPGRGRYSQGRSPFSGQAEGR